MTLSEKLAIASLCFSVVTTLCVLFLALATLVQSARPKLAATRLSSINIPCGRETVVVFGLFNRGHWYAKPVAVDVTVFCNFPPEFELREIRYGSVQEWRRDDVRSGVGGMRFLKAKGIKVAPGEPAEEIHVLVKTPVRPRSYRARLAAYSANGASLSEESELICTNVLPLDVASDAQPATGDDRCPPT